MTEEQLLDFDRRLRIVENLVVKIEHLIDILTKTTERVDNLEEHDKEILAFMHQTCQLKDKDIQNTREDAIKVATEHTNKLHQIAVTHANTINNATAQHMTDNHKQTLLLLGGQFSLFISAVVGFAFIVLSMSNSIVAEQTEAKNSNAVIEKLDTKFDNILRELHEHDLKAHNNAK